MPQDRPNYVQCTSTGALSKRTCFRRRSMIDAAEAVITGTAFLLVQHLLNGTGRVAHLTGRSACAGEATYPALGRDQRRARATTAISVQWRTSRLPPTGIQASSVSLVPCSVLRNGEYAGNANLLTSRWAPFGSITDLPSTAPGPVSAASLTYLLVRQCVSVAATSQPSSVMHDVAYARYVDY